MKPRTQKTGIEPCWIDRAVTAFGQPWVFVLACAFLLTPGKLIMGALNSGAAFLKIGTGARPAAMGEAYTALADDVNALYYNPGGLARLPRRELGATHTEWLLDTSFDFIGYAHPTNVGTFGLAVTRLAAGTQEGRSADRRQTSDFSASDTAFTLGYSRKLAHSLFASGSTSMGANIKYLQSTIGAYSASAVAFDFGAHHMLEVQPVSFGLSVLNVGQGMQFIDQRDPLPLTFAAGAAYKFGGALQLALDVKHEAYDKRTSVGIGSEYAVLPALSLRMGYLSGLAQASGDGAVGALSGLGGGLGLNMGNYRADYTFTPFGDLGNVQRISLGARF